MGERFPFGRTPAPPAVRGDERWMLETPEGAEVLARIRGSLCEESAVDLDVYAERVALDAIRARSRPRTQFSRPTLTLTGTA